MNLIRVPCAGPHKELGLRMMEAGQAEGFIPSVRSPLTGEEEMIIAQRATQDGFLNLGVAVFYPPEHADCLWLDVLYVAPEFRRQGVGRALVQEVRAIAREGRYPQFSVGTMLDNVPMLSLLKSIGVTGGLVFFDESLGGA